MMTSKLADHSASFESGTGFQFAVDQVADVTIDAVACVAGMTSDHHLSRDEFPIALKHSGVNVRRGASGVRHGFDRVKNVPASSVAEVSLRQSLITLEPLSQRYSDQGVIHIPLAKARQQFGDLLRETAATATLDNEKRQARLQSARTILQASLNGFEHYLSSTPRRSEFNGETLRDVKRSLTATEQALSQTTETR